MDRPNWDTYFLAIAKEVSTRASCQRKQHGCVIVNDNHTILSTGYNGAPSGVPECFVDGCIVVDNHCLNAEHAERNALFQAAREGIRLDGSTAYITGQPCVHCLRALISSGIKEIVYNADGHYSYSRDEQLLIDHFIKHSEMVVRPIEKVNGLGLTNRGCELLERMLTFDFFRFPNWFVQGLCEKLVMMPEHCSLVEFGGKKISVYATTWLLNEVIPYTDFNSLTESEIVDKVISSMRYALVEYKSVHEQRGDVIRVFAYYRAELVQCEAGVGVKIRYGDIIE